MRRLQRAGRGQGEASQLRGAEEGGRTKLVRAPPAIHVGSGPGKAKAMSSPCL